MMYDGGPSSPACAIRRSPASLARANSRWNLAGGLPTSAESRPMPAIGASMASSCSSTSSAESSDRSRRNAAISRVEMPNSSREFASTDATPFTQVSRATPRDTCACGSSMISACRTPASAARDRYARVMSAKSCSVCSTAMLA